MSRYLLLLLTALASTSSGQNVTHRWNFNSGTGTVDPGTVIPDLISGAPGTVVGVNANLSGTALT